MFGKKIEIISPKNIENGDFLTAYISKKVYSKSGDYVGRIYDMVVDDDKILGFMVKGKRRMFINKEYVSSNVEEIIMLSIEPVIDLIGKLVFDSEGRRLGKVTDVERDNSSNTFTSVIVGRGFLAKHFIIPKQDINVHKMNIILKKPYDKI